MSGAYSVMLVYIAAVIEGWDCGVATMQRSEIARFLVNPSYAFGDFGCPPRIPPGATSTLGLYCHVFAMIILYLQSCLR